MNYRQGVELERSRDSSLCRWGYRRCQWASIGIGIVPNITFVPASDAALGAPNHSNCIHIHVDVEFQNLGDFGVGYIEVGVIGEVMQSGKDGVVAIGRARAFGLTRPVQFACTGLASKRGSPHAMLLKRSSEFAFLRM